MGTKETVDGGCAHLEKEFLRFRRDLKHSFLLEHGYDLRQEWGQPLRADAATGLPHLKEGSLHIRGVDPWPFPAVEVLRFCRFEEAGWRTFGGNRLGRQIHSESKFSPCGSPQGTGAARIPQARPGLGPRFLSPVTPFMRNR